MCLLVSRTVPSDIEQFKKRIGTKKSVQVWKTVAIRNGEMRSPVFAYKWLPGENLAGGDSYWPAGRACVGARSWLPSPAAAVTFVHHGFHCYLCKPPEWETIIQLRVRVDDIMAYGHDSSPERLPCLVASRATLLAKDYAKAMAEARKKEAMIIDEAAC